jgi:hypothetical protein
MKMWNVRKIHYVFNKVGSFMKLSRYTVIFFFLLAQLACSGSEFAGNLKKKDADDSDHDDTIHQSQEDPDGDDLIVLDTIQDFLDGDDEEALYDGDHYLQRFSPDQQISEVDVVFVVDTSGSMGAEIDQIEANLDLFLNQLAESDETKNFQLFILAGKNDFAFETPPVALSNERFDIETFSTSHQVASYNGLAVAKAFMEGSIKTPKLSLREESKKHFVFVSDDDALSGADDGVPTAIVESEFRTFLETRDDKDEIHIHGIVCKTNAANCSHIGNAYINLAADDKYKGTILDLTAADWSPLMVELVNSINSTVDHIYKLNRLPKDPALVEVYINKTKIRSDKFSVDGDRVVIEKGLVKGGDDIVVSY